MFGRSFVDENNAPVRGKGIGVGACIDLGSVGTRAMVYINSSAMEPRRSKRSGVHPTYKTKYRASNEPEYDRGLVRRVALTVWFTPAVLRAWTPLPTGRSARNFRLVVRAWAAL